jgi:hypothetical protein
MARCIVSAEGEPLKLCDGPGKCARCDAHEAARVAREASAEGQLEAIARRLALAQGIDPNLMVSVVPAPFVLKNGISITTRAPQPAWELFLGEASRALWAVSPPTVETSPNLHSWGSIGHASNERGH